MIATDPGFYIQGVLDGNRRILSKTITLIESTLPDHQDMARTVLKRLLPHTGHSVRLGITGVPGVGKSTFIESLGMMLVEKGLRVGVLAVDPSSSRSGGSIMADKTRMEKLSIQKNAFIRPSPSGGTLGGVARKTRETLVACEAAGFEVMIIETVGVGQSEVAVRSMVDFFLVLMLAGAGDEIQGIKKGVLELADGIAVNKADEDNISKAKEARISYENALHLLKPSNPQWQPPVMTCSALTLAGIEAIWAMVVKHDEILKASGTLAEKRRKQDVDWMWSLVQEGLRDRFFNHPAVKALLPEKIRAVERGDTPPATAAGELLDLLD